MKGEVELLARALIKSKGKLLVCKRIGRKYFFFPGGHIDSGEKAEEALKRELREELGIRIKKCSFIGKIENSYIEDGKRHREINLVFDVKPIKVTTKSRESHLQFFLFDKKQIKKENVLPLIIKRIAMNDIKRTINLGIVINSCNKVLLVKRLQKEEGKDGAILNWAFPGGKQRKNESKKECVIREVLEETGYNIEPVKEISSRIHPQFPVFITYHLCRLITQEPSIKAKKSKEIAEVKWIKASEIEKMLTSDIDYRVRLELGIN